MNKVLALSALAAVLAVTAFGGAVAQRRSGGQTKPGAGLLARHVMNELNLTSDQRAQIKATLQRERPEIQSIVQRLEQQNAALHSQGTFNEGAVRQLAQQQSENITDAIVEREKIRAEIFAILTPEQQQKANQLTDEFHAVLEDRVATLGDAL